VDAFVDWVAANLVEGIGFYSAYPSQSVQDIRARAGVVQGAVNTGMIQSPLTVVMPVKSPTHLAAVSQLVAHSLPKFYEAADAIGTVHFARFVPLGTTALAYVSEYDGDFNKHIQDLSTRLGPLFDEMLENMLDPPPTPVQTHTEAFGHWIMSHSKKPFQFYSAYPNLSVQDIRAGVAKATQAVG